MDRNREDRAWCDGPDVGLSSAIGRRSGRRYGCDGGDLQFCSGGHCHVLTGIREDAG